MPYKPLSIAEGIKCLPSIWNIQFKPLEDDSYFVQTYTNRELADCVEFRLGTGADGAHEALVFIEDETLIDFLKVSTGEIYLFGAYNQVNVCQMRVLGKVTIEEDHPDADTIRERCRSAIAARVGSLMNKLSQEDAATRYSILDKGTLFRFEVYAYAYDTYDRG